MLCIKAAETILIVDTTVEEAKQAAGGFIKVDVLPLPEELNQLIPRFSS